ncbi:MAG: formylglycine-generating enzyme family protein [Fimbriimonadaceae bacterium]|nr:formylglycine-generating enzyme family protein [Fimbriimonadaceae bacterium]
MIALACVLAIGPVPRPVVDEVKIPGTVASVTLVRIPADPPYWMSATEITWDAYDPYAFRFDLTQEEQAAGVDAASRPSKPYGAPDKGFGHTGYPALGITFHSAEQYCAWLSRKTGRKFRLPTEREWDFAARAGARGEGDIDKVAWYWDNTEDKTQPVGKLAPNAYGLYDMLGNVQEWAIDKDGKPVTCGGSYRDKRPQIKFSQRAYQIPKWNENDPQIPKSRWWLSNAPYVGFRVVAEPD